MTEARYKLNELFNSARAHNAKVMFLLTKSKYKYSMIIIERAYFIEAQMDIQSKVADDLSFIGEPDHLIVAATFKNEEIAYVEEYEEIKNEMIRGVIQNETI